MSKIQWIKQHPFVWHAAVSGLFIWIIVRQIDLHSQIEAFRSFALRFFFLTVLIEFIIGYFYCYKWYLILRKMRIPASALALFLINHIAAFYALVVPSRLTQEAVKLYKVSRGRSKKLTYLTSILMDKATGACGLFLCGLIGVVLSEASFLTPDVKRLAWLSAMAIVFGVILFLLFPLENVADLFRSQYLNEIKMACRNIKQEKLFFVFICIYAVLLHMALPLTYWPLIKGSGFHVSLINLIWIYNLISFILILPVSISGFGIRESALIVILGKFGFSAEQAVVLSLLTVFAKLLQGIFFGLPLDLFWIKHYYRHAKTSANA